MSRDYVTPEPVARVLGNVELLPVTFFRVTLSPSHLVT